MDKQFVTTSASPHILLDVSGDLRLKGQDSFQVMAKSDNPNDLFRVAGRPGCYPLLRRLQCTCA